MAISCFRLDEIPDLSLHKYQSLADTGIDGVLKRHENFLRQWHGLCLENGSSIHLLYCYLPSEPMGRQLQAYFLIQGDEEVLKELEPLLEKSPLSDFFKLRRSDLPALILTDGATMTKMEQRAEIRNPLTGGIDLIHHVPGWKTNSEGRLYDLLRIMEPVSMAYTPRKACAFRIDLYPVSDALETRKAFAPVLRGLRGENDIRLTKDAGSIRADNDAQDICRAYEEWITAIETAPHFRVNIYGFAASRFKAKTLLHAAGAEVVSEGDYFITDIRPDPDGCFRLTSRMGPQADDYCRYATLPGAWKRWSTTFCLEEVVPLFRFPTLYDGEAIGIPKETAPAPVEGGICLGRDMNGYPVYIPLEDLPRHAFFTGMPGSGKTNTMLHLATQMRNRKIPFLILEPAKKEYRAILGDERMRDVFLFSPHLQSKFPLQMNPLAFPTNVRLSEHINALLEVFEGSFALEGPTYHFLSSAIQRSYTDLGWDIEEMNSEGCDLPYPTLREVYDNLKREIDASDYDGELKGNIRSFLQVRLGGLMERDAGELFNVRASTVRPDDWLKISAIVELEVLGEQAKNFFVLLVCHYILESLRSDPSGGVNKDREPMPVRHAILIEEAHNIIAQTTRQVGADSVDPKISATAYIVKMLAEVRALREAILIADQLPTALAAEVTKNTGLKLVHRLTAQDDREQIGTAISASPLQLERMASFTSGQAFIYHEKTMKPFEIQIDQWTGPKVNYDISDDTQLYSAIGTSPTTEKAVLTAFANWQDKVLFPTADAVAALQEQYIAVSDSDQTNLICCASARRRLQAECAEAEKKCRRLRDLWLPDGGAGHPLRAELEDALAYIEELENRLRTIPSMP